MADPRALIGKTIQRLRKRRNLSQAALAEKMGVHITYLSNIERGKENPTLDTFIKLSRALGVELAELFRHKHERPPKELRQFILNAISEDDDQKLRLAARVIDDIYQ